MIRQYPFPRLIGRFIGLGVCGFSANVDAISLPLLHLCLVVINLALGVNMVDTTTEPRTGLSPADVANMSLIELIDCLESLGDTSQFGTRFQYQNRIFQMIHECYGMGDKLPVSQVAYLQLIRRSDQEKALLSIEGDVEIH